MSTFNTKKTAQQAFNTFNTRLDSDITKLTAQKNASLNVFRNTITKIDASNTELAAVIENLTAYKNYIEGQIANAQNLMNENNTVRAKIVEIVGE